MQQGNENYETWKRSFCHSRENEAPTVLGTPSSSYFDAAFLVFGTFEEDNPRSYKDARFKTGYPDEVTRLANKLAKEDNYSNLKNTSEARNAIRQLPEYIQLNQRYGNSFNWRPIFWASVPPVGIGATYGGAAIRDHIAGVHDHVETVNSFFAENAPIIATALTAYYAVLFITTCCFRGVDFEKVNQGNGNTNNQQIPQYEY